MRRRARLKRLSAGGRPFPVRAVVFAGLLFVLFPLIVALRTRLWDGRLPVSVAVPDGEAVKIVVFDPEGGALTTIVIPGNTLLETTRRQGAWEIGKVWDVGEDEGLGGRLLAESMTKSFRLPVAAWANREFLAISGEEGSILLAIFSTETNLAVGDRVRMAVFAQGVNATAKSTLEASTIGLVKPALLPSGEQGFKPADNVGTNVTNLFSVSAVSEEGARVQIINRTGGREAVSKVSRILDVYGARVGLVTDQEVSDEDCTVLVQEESAVSKVLQQVLGCEVGSMDEGVFDVVILLGERFSGRF